VKSGETAPPPPTDPATFPSAALYPALHGSERFYTPSPRTCRSPFIQSFAFPDLRLWTCPPIFQPILSCPFSLLVRVSLAVSCSFLRPALTPTERHPLLLLSWSGGQIGRPFSEFYFSIAPSSLELDACHVQPAPSRFSRSPVSSLFPFYFHAFVPTP